MNIVKASIVDASEVLAIYKKYLATTITYQTSQPSVSIYAQKIEQTLKQYPFYLCKLDGKVVGYAYASRYRSREAFDWDVETSIYIDPDYNSKGIGSALYSKLLESLKFQNVINAYAFISVPNSKSEGLHKKLGFKQLCVLENCGFKNNQWCNLAIYHIQLNAPTTPPKEFISFSSNSFSENYF